jgi:hypothetical protein
MITIPNDVVLRGRMHMCFLFSESLLDPTRLMALRLTSNLMIGIARIYYQQYSYYAAEVNQVLMQLRRTLHSMNDAGPKEITLQQPMAR